MRRFTRIDPAQPHQIQARSLNFQTLKPAWLDMSEEAEVQIAHLANTRPDTPIGVAFVNTQQTGLSLILKTGLRPWDV